MKPGPNRVCGVCGTPLSCRPPVVVCSSRCSVIWRWQHRVPEDAGFFLNVYMSDGCWEWVGRRQTAGYGVFGGELAHRVIYERCVGPIPKGFHLEHLCRNRSCVRLDHLEAVCERVDEPDRSNR